MALENDQKEFPKRIFNLRIGLEIGDERKAINLITNWFFTNPCGNSTLQHSFHHETLLPSFVTTFTLR